MSVTHKHYRGTKGRGSYCSPYVGGVVREGLSVTFELRSEGREKASTTKIGMNCILHKRNISTQVLISVWAQYIGANRDGPVWLEHREWAWKRDELRKMDRGKIRPLIGLHFNNNGKTSEVFK